MSSESEFLERICSVSVEGFHDFTRHEYAIGNEIISYFNLFGVPDAIDMMLSRSGLSRQLAGERLGLVEKYQQFCDRRNKKVAGEVFAQLKQSGLIVPCRPGSQAHVVNQESAQLFNELMPEDLRGKLFFGAGIDSNGIHPDIVAQHMRFDPVCGHAQHPLSPSSTEGMHPEQLQYERALKYARDKQIERLFPGRSAIIANYEIMMREARSLDIDRFGKVSDQIAAFATHCGKYGIPKECNMNNICAQLRVGSTEAIDRMMTLVEKGSQQIKAEVLPTPPPAEMANTTKSAEKHAASWVARIWGHPAGKLAIIGGTTALGAVVTYRVFKSRQERGQQRETAIG